LSHPPRKPPNRTAVAYELLARTYEEWAQDPDGERLRREDEEARRELARHLPPEAVPPPRELPAPLGPGGQEYFAAMATFYRALARDEPPKGDGLLLGLAGRYLDDPEDSEVWERLDQNYPEASQALRTISQRLEAGSTQTDAG
jgi:hypothetical protein